jgi:hypothetical protein
LAVKFPASTRDLPHAPRKEIKRIATQQRDVVGAKVLADLLINRLSLIVSLIIT